jgi:amino acid transporter
MMKGFISAEESASAATALPRRHVGALQGLLLALGMIITTDTLKTTPTVALAIGNWHFYGIWIAGGLLSMLGALCYVEMATAFPDPGGDYHFLRKAYGIELGFLFAWSRFAVMHTGWIALMAFMFADYVTALVPLGHAGATLFAMATILVLVLLNLRDVRLGFLTQAGLVSLVALGFASIVAASTLLWATQRLPPAAAVPSSPAPSLADFSTALIYIFLAYGGWSDAATLSAEMRNGRRGMFIAIAGSLFLLILIYLALNWAFLLGLGLDAFAHAEAPAADLLGRAFGPAGKALIVGIVGIAAVASINSTLIVGARTTYAAARDLPRASRLGRWDGARGVPARAVIAEGAVAILLVGFGSFTESGFNAMVAYMTPVYWFFMILSITALMILRRRFPDVARPVVVPLYPAVPLAFLAVSIFMLWSSLLYVGFGVLFGVSVLLVGAVLIALALRPRFLGRSEVAG